jgi:type I restriction enzyme S subunit
MRKPYWTPWARAMGEPLIDIRPDHWAIVREILQRHVPQYEVWAFGSRATWKAKEYSDLDLAVISDKPLGIAVSAALADDFSESDLPWRVDVVDWAATSETFRKIIERDKVVVQSAKTERVIAHEWDEVPVERIAAKVRNALVGGPFGSNLVSKDYVDQGVPVIRGQNMGERWVSGEFAYVSEDKAKSLEANIARPGDIVFTQRGTLGQVALVPDSPFEGYVVSQSQMKLTVDREQADPLFFYYQFSSPAQHEYIKQHSIQVGVPHTNLGILRETPVVVPPIDEQRAIANVLGTLDDKIELNRRMNETLEAIARAIFKSWFVDFDPVRAKASGEAAESIYRRLGLTRDLLALFPDRLVDSELGEIPEGWEAGTLADHCYLNAESWTAKTLPPEIHYVDLANAKNGEISEVQVFSSSEEPSRARRVLRTRDTIVGTVRPGNRSLALIGQSDLQLTGSTGFAVITPKREELREFVYLLATSDANIDRLSRLADGAAYPAVRPDVVTAGVCVSPPSSVIDAFHATTAAMADYQIANRVTNQILVSVRDTLLPKLLSGELRAPDSADIYETT